MNLVLWIPACYLAVLGIFSLLNPELLKDFMSRYAEVRFLRIRGVLIFMLGILFLYFSWIDNEKFFLKIVGFTSVFLGLFDFIFPSLEKRNAKWWVKTPNWVIRILGIFLLMGSIAFASAPLFATLTNI